VQGLSEHLISLITHKCLGSIVVPYLSNRKGCETYKVLKLSILIGVGCISVSWLCLVSIYNALTHGYIS
jgi:hypothetical protein